MRDLVRRCANETAATTQADGSPDQTERNTASAWRPKTSGCWEVGQLSAASPRSTLCFHGNQATTWRPDDPRPALYPCRGWWRRRPSFRLRFPKPAHDTKDVSGKYLHFQAAKSPLRPRVVPLLLSGCQHIYRSQNTSTKVDVLTSIRLPR